jgi:hypothetical protein
MRVSSSTIYDYLQGKMAPSLDLLQDSIKPKTDQLGMQNLEALKETNELRKR